WGGAGLDSVFRRFHGNRTSLRGHDGSFIASRPYSGSLAARRTGRAALVLRASAAERGRASAPVVERLGRRGVARSAIIVTLCQGSPLSNTARKLRSESRRLARGASCSGVPG